MQLNTEQLPNDPVELKALLFKALEEKEIEIKRRDNRIVELEELVRFFKARQFSRSSEVIHPGQGTLFNEVESSSDSISDTNTTGVETQKITYERKRPVRKPLPKSLPREVITYELSDVERTCSCGACLHEIGEEVSEQLDVIPAQFKVLRHVRKKYACRSCESGVTKAAMPKQAIPKSYASAGLLAYIATSKYVDGLPLNRLETVFSRLDCDIPRSTQATWMIKAASLVIPLINLLLDELLSGHVLHIDETTIQVLKEKGRSPSSKSFMWVMARGDPGRKIILFHYDPGRNAQVANDLVPEYRGYLVTDGYSGYSSLGSRNGIVHCGCWDHVRRKFHDVLKTRKKGTKPGLADEFLYWIQQLYAVERRCKGETDKRRLTLRNLYSRGIVAYIERMKNENLHVVTPKSLTGKALHYLDRQWPKLTRFLEDGAVPLSNQLAENAIRPFVVGRKAWLFADTPSGAHASAALYSVIETAKANGIDPYQYLRVIFEKLPQAETVEDIEALLPWNINLS